MTSVSSDDVSLLGTSSGTESESGKGDSTMAKNVCGGSCCCALLVLIVAYFGCTLNYVLPNPAGVLAAENQRIAWWNMPVMQPWALQEKLKANMTPFLPDTPPEVYRNGTWSEATGKEAARIMYEATHFGDQPDDVPSKLHGVFWFQGDATGEKLVVLRYSRWFEKEQILVQPIAPFMWAFESSRGAPGSYLAGVAVHIPGAAFSYSFSECPANAEYCTPGSNNLSNGLVQNHPHGDMAIASPNPPGPLGKYFPSVQGIFGFEELEKSTPRFSQYRRSCFWGLGRCTFIEFGSYTLTKVLDAYGNPNEPHYTEFMKRFGDSKLYMWTGFKDEASMETASSLAQAQ